MSRIRRGSVAIASAEIDRELGDTLGRQANAVTRAAIVVAASGITGVVQITLSPAWPSIIVSVFAFTTAFVGASAVQLWPSVSVQLSPELGREWIRSDARLLEQRILADKMSELVEARNDLRTKNSRLSWAMWLLTITWCLSLVVNILPIVLTQSGVFS